MPSKDTASSPHSCVKFLRGKIVSVVQETSNGTRVRSQVQILGVPIDRVTLAETTGLFREFLQGDCPNLVITADATGVMIAQDDARLKAHYQSASLVTPDGDGILWAAKCQGVNIVQKVSGVVLVEKLCELSAQTGAKIFLLGAAEGVAAQAAKNLTEKYPGCNIVGVRNGFFKPDEDLEVANYVASFQPDILLVAMGIPRQETFIKETESIIGAKISMGIGGSLDVHSGVKKRAPKIVQRIKLEWLWRLLQDPTKIHKVKYLPRFYAAVRRELK